jgi:hypothetical protein
MMRSQQVQVVCFCISSEESWVARRGGEGTLVMDCMHACMMEGRNQSMYVSYEAAIDNRYL